MQYQQPERQPWQPEESTTRPDYAYRPDTQQSYEQGYQPGYRQPEMPLPPYGQGQPVQPVFAPFYTYSRFVPFDGLSTGSKLLGGLSYVGGWLTGLLVLLFVRDNRFARFHAWQSLLFFGGINIAYVIFFSFMHRHPATFLEVIAVLLFVLMNIVCCVGWFVGLIGALSGKYVKLPFVGTLADNLTPKNTNATVK